MTVIYADNAVDVLLSGDCANALRISRMKLSMRVGAIAARPSLAVVDNELKRTASVRASACVSGRNMLEEEATDPAVGVGVGVSVGAGAEVDKGRDRKRYHCTLASIAWNSASAPSHCSLTVWTHWDI